MNLPTSLLNDFAKVTNDEAEKSKEYTMFGKVVSVNTQTGKYNVLLDGADTPIICDATTTAKQNDRVTVSVKNRQPTVIGNASSKTINGDVLVNGNGTFKGRVEAESGYFKGELQAATGTFAGDLSAAGGSFKGSLSAATGSFVGSLSAATGTFNGGGKFNGEVNVSANTSNGTIQVTICQRDAQSRVAIPIRISEKYSSQPSTEYRITIGGDGATLECISSGTVIQSTDLGYGGFSAWASGVGTTSVTPYGVSGPNNSRLIAGSEITKLGNYPTSPPAKWNSPVSWVNREDEYVYKLAAGGYHWYVLTKPTDTNYNWYLINAVADENDVWVLHTSQTGAYLYNHSSGAYSNLYITGYWLGIHK